MICDTVDSPAFMEVAAKRALKFKAFLKFGHNIGWKWSLEVSGPTLCSK